MGREAESKWRVSGTKQDLSLSDFQVREVNMILSTGMNNLSYDVVQISSCCKAISKKGYPAERLSEN